MRIARFEVKKEPPYGMNERSFIHITIQPTRFGQLTCTPKHFFFLRNKEKNLGLPPLSETTIEELWDNHASGEIFEVTGVEVYSERYLKVFKELFPELC